MPRVKSQDEIIQDRAYKRLKKLSTVEILEWIDQAGSGMSKAVDDYRRLGQPDSLEEARLGGLAVLAAIDVVRDRVSD